ncbi:MAG TPA: hypothetical protein VFU11_06635 [Solirubrobacterales bacterium]|nr:hypothetical protein [Solirubrobacterales bacterium]
MPALAANPDACGLASQHTMARAFDLTNSVQHKTVVKAPGNPAGVVQTRCRAFAWKGAKPTTKARQRAGLAAGTVATYDIEAWVADSGPSSEVWLGNFPKKLAALKDRARAQFIEGSLKGRKFAPPTFDFESALGYQAPVGGTRKLRALWWNRDSGTLIAINVTEDKDRPVGLSLRRLAAAIIPKVE